MARLPSSIPNMTRSFCHDYLKNQITLIAIQLPLKSQMHAVTLVQNEFKLTVSIKGPLKRAL